jgi:hypothetical protein
VVLSRVLQIPEIIFWLWCFSKEVQFQFGWETGEWIDEESLTLATYIPLEKCL